MAYTFIMTEGNRFRKLGLVTVGIIYLLILVGGLVRATGSGMGCPDWPKCFGMWVPPTTVEQLPANYQEIFGAKLKGEVEFKVTKTWIEYLNRLLGALSGLFVFASLIASISYLKKDKWVFIWSFLAFIGIGFQGWLGSKVVSSELKPVMVTIHMVVAIIIVFMLIYAVARSYYGRISLGEITNSKQIQYLLIFGVFTTMMQIVLGTQVRQAIDIAAKALGEVKRGSWIEETGLIFIIHRTFSWIVLILNGVLLLLINRNTDEGSNLRKLGKVIFGLVLSEIALGVVLAYLDMSKYAQPFHLTVAVLIAGAQYWGIVLINREKMAVASK